MDYARIKKDFDKKKAKRSNFDRMYQTIGEYVAMNRQDFEGKPADGEFLTDRLFDATGAFAATNCASSLLGMLWPGAAANTFELIPYDDDDVDEEWFKLANRKTHAAFDDPKANLSESLEEYMNDQIMFGTSGIGSENGTDSLLYFSPYGVKEVYLICGKGGRIVGFYLFFEWTVERAVAEFGINKVSTKVADAHKRGLLDQTVKVLFCCKPREEKKATRGKFAMPIMGVYLDYTDCVAMKEEGYPELPIAIGRFRKLNYEEMGRSLAMNALPDIREANALREAIIIATEKVLEMPKGVLSDGELGGAFIDQSAGAVNVFNSTGTVGGGNPVFDIGSPPNIPWAEKRLEKLEQTIAQHFMLDRMLDFNNETQMTLGETQIRDQIRTASMGATFNRQIQVITQVIERGVRLLFTAGELGVIRGSDKERELLAKGIEPEYLPDGIAERVAAGKDIYKVRYKTKASMAFASEQYLGILEMFNIALKQAEVNPAATKRVDFDAGLKKIADIRGLGFMMKSDDTVKQETEAEQKQAMAAQMLQAGEQVAGMADKFAGAQQKAKA